MDSRLVEAQPPFNETAAQVELRNLLRLLYAISTLIKARESAWEKNEILISKVEKKLSQLETAQ